MSLQIPKDCNDKKMVLLEIIQGASNYNHGHIWPVKTLFPGNDSWSVFQKVSILTMVGTSHASLLDTVCT